MWIIGNVRRGLLFNLLLKEGLAVKLKDFAQSFVPSVLKTSKTGDSFSGKCVPKGQHVHRKLFSYVQLESPLLQFRSSVFPSPTMHYCEKQIASTSLPSFANQVILSQRPVIVVTPDLPLVNPFWLFSITLFSFLPLSRRDSNRLKYEKFSSCSFLEREIFIVILQAS